jgi:hypothetical protein
VAAKPREAQGEYLLSCGFLRVDNPRRRQMSGTKRLSTNGP